MPTLVLPFFLGNPNPNAAFDPNWVKKTGSGMEMLGWVELCG